MEKGTSTERGGPKKPLLE